MINSVTFPQEGKGYIYSKYVCPRKPSADDRRYQHYLNYDLHHAIGRTRLSPEGKKVLEADLKQYKKELKFYNEHKGEFSCPAAQCLVGKTFRFEPDKINVLFAPNGAGKSTILKAIAGCVNSDDGFTALYCDSLYGNYENVCFDKAENSAELDWTGNAVYYFNFEAKHGRPVMAGDMVGSLMADNLGDELLYCLNRNRVSSGQHNTMLINRLLDVASQHYCLKDILCGSDDYLAYHDKDWSKKYISAQMDVLNKLPDFEKTGPMTMLMDEIDKSYDIETCYILYHDLLPKILREHGTQFILVSHNMFMLSDKVCPKDIYNIIPLDQDYYDSAKKIITEKF